MSILDRCRFKLAWQADRYYLGTMAKTSTTKTSTTKTKALSAEERYAMLEEAVLEAARQYASEYCRMVSRDDCRSMPMYTGHEAPQRELLKAAKRLAAAGAK